MTILDESQSSTWARGIPAGQKHTALCATIPTAQSFRYLHLSRSLRRSSFLCTTLIIASLPKKHLLFGKSIAITWHNFARMANKKLSSCRSKAIQRAPFVVIIYPRVFFLSLPLALLSSSSLLYRLSHACLARHATSWASVTVVVLALATFFPSAFNIHSHRV